jgi:hypothetical protein
MAYMYARMMKQTVAALALLVAALALSLVIGAAEEGWRLKWVNPREEIGLPNTALPLYRMYQTRYAEEDGGYTFTVHFKKSPKIWYLNSPVDYSEEHAVFARRIVEAWNASIRFAAENYEWARHLSKLRLKFYTDENVTQAPHVDVVVDAGVSPASCGALVNACTLINTDPMRIYGLLSSLSHELGHALGLGHNYDVGPVEYGRDWRGWLVGGGYPSESLRPSPDTFVLYGLAVRWGSLKNAKPGDQISFPKDTTIYYKDVADKLGPLYSFPGLHWVYYYTVLSSPGGVEVPLIIGGWAHMGNQSSVLMKPYPEIHYTIWFLRILQVFTLHGGTLCIHPLDWEYLLKYTLYSIKENSDLPFLKFYANSTSLVLKGIDVGLAIVDSKWESDNAGVLKRTVWFPKKYFTKEILKELSKDTLLGWVEVIDSLGPAWDKVSSITYSDGRVCLEGIKDRLLVEMKVGRAYKVEVPVEPVVVNGTIYRDTNGTYWVLEGSKVYLKPLEQAFVTERGVRYVWKGLNETIIVSAPLTLSNPSVSKFWKKQYLVEVDSPYPFDGVGWFDEGARVSPRPKDGYVDLGNGTRLVLKGFEGYNGTEVVVDRPLKLKPVWERMYRVDTVSRYLFSEAGRYVKEGGRIFTLMERAKDFGNGTRIRLANITAYGPKGEVVAAWDGESGSAQFAQLSLTVDRPVTIKVDWRVYHRLTVTSPVNSYEEWVLNGTVHRLDLPEKKLVGGDTLMVLKRVKVNGEPYQGLEVTVTSPTSVEAVYQRRLMTTIMVDAGKGYLVEPSEVVLERGGEVEVYRPPFTYIGEGTWRVTKVTYLGGDIAVDATVEVNIAGMKTIPSRLRAVEVTVVDIIGLPVPYASVKAENIAEVTGISGTATLPAIPPWDFKVTASHLLGGGAATIRPNETAVRVTAGVSPYTIALLAAVAVLGAVAWRRRASQR